jgi:hypothetical protein
VSDPVLRFPDRTWDELEGLPQPLRNAAHRAIFHLLDEPVPALADPFPEVDPLPGAYRLQLPSDGLTIWYTVTESPDGQVVIIVQYVKADTWIQGRDPRPYPSTGQPALVLDGVGGELVQRGVEALNPFGRLVVFSAGGGTVDAGSLLGELKSVIGFSIGLISRTRPGLVTQRRAEPWDLLAAAGCIRSTPTSRSSR